jgi:hypothetical protein
MLDKHGRRVSEAACEPTIAEWAVRYAAWQRLCSACDESRSWRRRLRKQRVLELSVAAAAGHTKPARRRGEEIEPNFGSFRTIGGACLFF